MITKNDCLLLLAELKDRNIDTKPYVIKTLNSTSVDIEVLKFINKNRPLELGLFYESLRKRYNEGKSKLYKEIGQRFNSLDSWSAYIITGYEEAQKYIGRKADKNRKIYNGMMKTYLYQYMGPKPPRKKD